jgi:hypothetical protein
VSVHMLDEQLDSLLRFEVNTTDVSEFMIGASCYAMS